MGCCLEPVEHGSEARYAVIRAKDGSRWRPDASAEAIRVGPGEAL